MTPDELVERVARAGYDATKRKKMPAFDELHGEALEYEKSLARAAITIALEEAAAACLATAHAQARLRDLEAEDSVDWQIYNQGVFIASSNAHVIRTMMEAK
jgi:hypothetical protein